MRNLVLAVIVGLAGLTVGAALVVLGHHAPAPVAATASPPDQAVASVPPAPEAVPAPETTATPPASEPAPAASAPAAPAAPDLPTVDVTPLAVHTVPNDDTSPVPTVTLQDRDGRTIKEIKPAQGLSPTYVPSVGPGSRQSFASTAPAPSYSLGPSGPVMVPPINGSRLATTVPSGALFSGAGQAAGGITLSVSGRYVSLFGVRVADPRDQCGLGAGDNRSCATVARDALAQRLQHYANVSCHVPPGQRGQPGAVCTDSSGTDLGGFLVSEGYALADTSQSYDYFGAEGVARSYRRGLWRYR
jgi:endonuclease YncB( thermonuclease family)